MKTLTAVPAMTPVSVPEDGTDRRTAASLEGPFQALLNRTTLFFGWRGAANGVAALGANKELAVAAVDSSTNAIVGAAVAGRTGVLGTSGSGSGVGGSSTSGPGLSGTSVTGPGVIGISSSNPGGKFAANTARGAVNIAYASGGTMPTAGEAGDMFFDTTSNSLKVHNGTAWMTATLT